MAHNYRETAVERIVVSPGMAVYPETVLSHPSVIPGEFSGNQFAKRRFSSDARQKKISRLAVKARRETAKAKKSAERCQCGTCYKCKQRESKRAYEARNAERKRVNAQPPTIAENATVRVPLSTAPDIAFLDRLIASNWGDVPRTLLPDEVAQAVEAGEDPPSPSFDIVWAAERSPGSLPAAIAKWTAERATANG